jgi:hypothetical protein
MNVRERMFNVCSAVGKNRLTLIGDLRMPMREALDERRRLLISGKMKGEFPQPI